MISPRPTRRTLISDYRVLSIRGEDRRCRRRRAIAWPTFLTITLNDGRQHVATSVKLTTTSLHYGGQRPWLLCPSCGRRRRDLLVAGLHVGCRACEGAAYASQWRSQRAMRRLSGETVSRMTSLQNLHARHGSPPAILGAATGERGRP